MSEDSRSNQIQDELRLLIHRYGEGPVKRALKDISPRRVGRPTGWQIDDWKALENMERLLRTGEAKTVTEAARKSVHLTENHEATSTIHRLSKKYREQELFLRIHWQVVGAEEFRKQAEKSLTEPSEKLKDALNAIHKIMGR